MALRWRARPSVQGWQPVILVHALTPPSLVRTFCAMPPAPAYAVLASAFRTRNPIHVHRWLAVFGWCTPTIRQNVSEVLPDAVLPPGFCPSIVPRGYVLGSPRLCHTSASGDSLDVRVGEVLRVLKSCDADADLSKDLCQFANEIDGDVVLKVLQKKRSNWQVALLFFTWAAGLPTYEHGPRTYIEMLDILGRMKKVRLMRQLFDEIPEQRRGLVVTNRMFVVLFKRYGGAHKVQEAIETFYKINDYGFEVDLVGFQILLMSLCCYKHVEEDEALFLQKKDEFPPVIKSWNIILNGWHIVKVVLQPPSYCVRRVPKPMVGGLGVSSTPESFHCQQMIHDSGKVNSELHCCSMVFSRWLKLSH
ncbi:putative pentatricopeptide repeat-containing protein [Hordeum vulgare]|nr:putative pentatricopeptide repeat-containing protein [Hordeum vulgare]